MNPDRAAAPDAHDDCAALESLVLDGCQALDAYLAHPCDVHAEELEHLQAALVAASAGADPQQCDDLLDVAAQLRAALAEVRPVSAARGAA